jgi:hypothetical protein
VDAKANAPKNANDARTPHAGRMVSLPGSNLKRECWAAIAKLVSFARINSGGVWPEFGQKSGGAADNQIKPL